MNKPKTGRCIWEPYERYSQGAIFRAEFTARDLYEVMRKVVDHLHTCIGDDCFEKPDDDWDEDELEYNFWLPKNATQEERDEMGFRILDMVMDNNGNVYDFITLLEWNGEKLIEEESEPDNEQNWG
jgi:hypothetical protein